MKDVKKIIKLLLIDLDLWDIEKESLEGEAMIDCLYYEVEELDKYSYDPDKLKEKLTESFKYFDNNELIEDEPILEKFTRALSTRLYGNKVYGDEVEEVVDEHIKHTCELCNRILPLTFHHLIPRETHSQMFKKGLFTKEYMRTHGTMICRKCHSAVHRTFSNKTLALEYNTIDKLLASPEIQKWIKFAERQKVRIKFFRSI